MGNKTVFKGDSNSSLFLSILSNGDNNHRFIIIRVLGSTINYFSQKIQRQRANCHQYLTSISHNNTFIFKKPFIRAHFELKAA